MFKIINLSDGSQKDCDIVKLSRSLSPNCEIMRIIDDKFEAIGFVSHSLLVFFAVEAAQYALQKHTKNTFTEVEICVNLTKKWIEDNSSVSKDELNAAASAFHTAAAYGAAFAASAASYAAASYAAADAASYAAYAGREKELIRQANFILKYFNAL